MATEEKKVTGNETPEEKDQQGTPGTSTEEPKKEGIFKKIGSGLKKHGKKIGVGLGIAAAFAAGVAADKVGIPKLGGKSEENDPEE